MLTSAPKFLSIHGLSSTGGGGTCQGVGRRPHPNGREWLGTDINAGIQSLVLQFSTRKLEPCASIRMRCDRLIPKEIEIPWHRSLNALCDIMRGIESEPQPRF